MKKSMNLILVGMVATALLSGCKDETPKAVDVPAAAPVASPVAAAPAAEAGQSGTVVETMNSAGYTYVQVDTGAEKIWAAAPEFKVSVGDDVVVPQGMPMQEYHSQTLDRTFPVLYFVPRIMVAGADPAADSSMPADHPSVAATSSGTPPVVTPADIDLTGIEKPAEGVTVAEIFSGKDSLSGKEVTLRGRVVKYSAQIMGKNWVHLQDGTGEAGTSDLTVTTSSEAKVGDTVLVTGQVVTNKDFGYGYNYDVLIEDAKVVVE